MEKPQADEHIPALFDLFQVYVGCWGENSLIAHYSHRFLIQLSADTITVGVALPDGSSSSDWFWYDWKEANTHHWHDRSWDKCVHCSPDMRVVCWHVQSDQTDQEFPLCSYTSGSLHVEQSRLLVFRMKKHVWWPGWSNHWLGMWRYLLTWQLFPKDRISIAQSCTWYWMYRCRSSLNYNLIVLLKPDIDLDMSRSSIQNAVSEVNDN